MALVEVVTPLQLRHAASANTGSASEKEAFSAALVQNALASGLSEEQATGFAKHVLTRGIPQERAMGLLAQAGAQHPAKGDIKATVGIGSIATHMSSLPPPLEGDDSMCGATDASTASGSSSSFAPSSARSVAEGASLIAAAVDASESSLPVIAALSTSSGAGGMHPAIQDPAVVVQQALQQQQQLAIASRQQFQSQVDGLNKLLEVQSKGFEQTQKQVLLLLKDLEQHLMREPQVKEHFEQLLQCTKQANQVHHLQEALLAKLQQTHASVQDAQLQQTQGQVAGLHQLLQMQSNQLQHTQRQVHGLQAFGAQAQLAVEQVAKSHDTRLRATQNQVSELQVQLANTFQVQEERRSRLKDEQAAEVAQAEQELGGPTLSTTEPRLSQTEVSRKEVRALEDEIDQLVDGQGEFPSDSEDEWV